MAPLRWSVETTHPPAVVRPLHTITGVCTRVQEALGGRLYVCVQGGGALPRGAGVMAINCTVLSLLFGVDRGSCAGAAGGNLLPYFRWAGNGFGARVHASHYGEERGLPP